MSIRETIVREARRQGLSAYRVAKLAGLSIRTVQSYFSETYDLGSERASAIAAVLGLELRRARRANRKVR